MKVEIDLGEEQLKLLDESMSNLLENLTEEQKTKILSDYITNKFNNIEEETTNYYGRKENCLTDFGKQLVDNLQNKITKVVSDKVLENESAKKIINDSVNAVVENIDEIVQKSITTYIVENLFLSESKMIDTVSRMVYQATNDLRGEIYNRR